MTKENMNLLIDYLLENTYRGKKIPQGFILKNTT